MEQLKQAAEQVPNMPPQTREAIASLAAQGGISTLIYILGFIVTLVLYSAGRDDRRRDRSGYFREAQNREAVSLNRLHTSRRQICLRRLRPRMRSSTIR